MPQLTCPETSATVLELQESSSQGCREVSLSLVRRVVFEVTCAFQDLPLTNISDDVRQTNFQFMT